MAQLQRSDDNYAWYSNQFHYHHSPSPQPLYPSTAIYGSTLSSVHNHYYSSPPQSYTLSSAYNTFHQPPFNYSHFLPPAASPPTPLSFLPSSQPINYYFQQYQHLHPQYNHQHNSYELQRLGTWKNDDKNKAHQVFDKIPEDEVLQQFNEDDQICEIVETDGLNIASSSTVLENIEKLTDSEVDLHEDLRKLKVIAGAPDLYPEIVASNSVPSIVNLLAHENADIANDVVQLLQVLTDEDAVEDNNDPARKLVNALVESENKSSEELKKRTREQNCGKKQMAEEEAKEKEETQEKEEEVSTITFSDTKDEESPEIMFSAVSDSEENNSTANLLEDENLTPPGINATAMIHKEDKTISVELDTLDDEKNEDDEIDTESWVYSKDEVEATKDCEETHDGSSFDQRKQQLSRILDYEAKSEEYHKAEDKASICNSLSYPILMQSDDYSVNKIEEAAKLEHVSMEVKHVVAELVCEKTKLLLWLLAKIKMREFEGIKRYVSEVLVILLQNSTTKKWLGQINGVDAVLEGVAMYKSKDPKTLDEEKMLENLFHCLCCLLMPLEKCVYVEFSEANLDEEMRVLDQEFVNLGDEQRKLEQNAEFVDSEMFVECQKLLQISGIPYIVAPMEAEAQGALICILSEKETPFYAAQDERIVDMQGEALKILKALEAIVGHLRKFLVDHTVVPLFEKQYLARVSLARQEEPLADNKSSLHTLSPNVSQTMKIPFSYAEDIIGLEGANIAYSRRRSGATITIQESPHPDQITVDIKGTSSQVQTAEQLIQEFINNHKKPNSKGNLSSKPAESIKKCQSQESVIIVDAVAYENAAPGDRLSEVTVMLRAKFRNYLQAVVEKHVENNKLQKPTMLKKILQDYKKSVGESDIRNKMNNLKEQLTKTVNHVHSVCETHVFIALSRGYWDRMGQIVLSFLENRKENRAWYKGFRVAVYIRRYICSTDAILENAETSLQLGSKLLTGFGVMSDDVSFLSKVFRDSMEIQAQDEITANESNAGFKPMQMKASDKNADLIINS